MVSTRRTVDAGPNNPNDDDKVLANEVLPLSGLDRHTSRGRPDIESGAQSPTSTLVSQEQSGHLSGWKLASVLFALLLSIFIVVLDRTIVATAIPVITSDFHGLSEAPWIATVYFLTQAGCMLTFGQILSLSPMLWVYLIALGIFEFGSVLCGAAWSMNSLIVGRAVAGMGSSGVMVSCTAITARITRLDQRAMVFSFFAGTLALGSIVGPLLGGALTSRVSWRWCFFINLPFGAVTVLALLVFLRPAQIKKVAPSNDPFFTKVLRIDWIGSVIYFGSVTSILIGLQWGGVERPWNNTGVIVVFCVGAALFVTFILWERRLGMKAVLPLRLFSRRTTVGAAITAFMIMLFVMVGTYYLPLFYQSAREKSAVQAGIDVLPFMLATVVGNVVSSVITTRTGLPWPWLIGGPLVASLGSGLLFWALTSTASVSSARIIAFQIVLGLGAGSSVQQSMIVIQAEYRNEPNLIPQAAAMINAFQLFGGMVGVAISGTIFSNKLRTNLLRFAPDLPSELASQVVESVDAIHEVPAQWMQPVLHSYANALGYVFIVGVPVGIISAMASLLMKRHNLKQPRPAATTTTPTAADANAEKATTEAQP